MLTERINDDDDDVYKRVLLSVRGAYRDEATRDEDHRVETVSAHVAYMPVMTQQQPRLDDADVSASHALHYSDV